jgi:hypothetical protein
MADTIGVGANKPKPNSKLKTKKIELAGGRKQSQIASELQRLERKIAQLDSELWALRHRRRGLRRETVRQKKWLRERRRELRTARQVNALRERPWYSRAENRRELKDRLNQNDQDSIGSLPITARSVRCLLSHGIDTIDRLTRTTGRELSRYRALGELSILDIRRRLAERGLSLADET